MEITRFPRIRELAWYGIIYLGNVVLQSSEKGMSLGQHLPHHTHPRTHSKAFPCHAQFDLAHVAHVLVYGLRPSLPLRVPHLAVVLGQ